MICGLDIGTTKIAAIIGEFTPSGIEILGVGTHRSDGLRQGVVVNIEATTKSIAAAVQEAEQMADARVETVYVGIAGGHIQGFSSTGQVSMRNREVTEADVARVLEQAKAVNIPLDRQILHTIPIEYIIDGQGQIRDPIGMSGVRMEVRAHVITAAVTSVQNIVKCCNRAELDVQEVVLEPIASSLAVLHEDEMDLGVTLIDMGGGTTDIAVYHEGSDVFTSVLVMGGQRITQDVAHGLRTSVAEAERLKNKHGCALARLVGDDEEIEVPGVGPRPPRQHKRKFLAEIIEPRVEEILLLAHQSLLHSGCADLAASGIVLTGGAAQLEGICELAEDIFRVPVRRGIPEVGVGGVRVGDARVSVKDGGFSQMIADPRFSTAVGLVLYGAAHEPLTDGTYLHDDRPSLGRRLSSWVRELF
ncbi:MAG: cell division protein FtsA [Deltaproteobacteria bacterium]|nr:MAG: cell division protein FtsA [Deltaproteobacteria bacterium]